MKTYYAVAISMLAGVVLGGAAIQGLHAQTKSSKAYTVTELETLDAKTAADVAARIQKMQEAQAAIISVLAVERLRLWKDRRRLSVSRSRNGIILRKHRHSSSRRPGPILDRNVIRLSRPYADMRWNSGLKHRQSSAGESAAKYKEPRRVCPDDRGSVLRPAQCPPCGIAGEPLT